MAKIEGVDYMSIPGETAKMKEKGKELNTSMIEAYKLVEEMHANWQGKRYNTLCKSFNEMIEPINELLKMIITDIPDALDSIAGNYEMVDTGAQTIKPAGEQPEKISDLTVNEEEVKLRFMQTEVESTREQVSTKFESAKGVLDDFKSIYEGIDWQSEAADAFKNKFETLKSQLEESFTKINDQFKDEMEATASQMQETETANTVS